MVAQMFLTAEDAAGRRWRFKHEVFNVKNIMLMNKHKEMSFSKHNHINHSQTCSLIKNVFWKLFQQVVRRIRRTVRRCSTQVVQFVEKLLKTRTELTTSSQVNWNSAVRSAAALFAINRWINFAKEFLLRQTWRLREGPRETFKINTCWYNFSFARIARRPLHRSFIFPSEWDRRRGKKSFDDVIKR